MATIQINDDWRVETDPRNWILQKRSVVSNTDVIENLGKECWANVAYYPTLPDAVKGMVNKDIKVPINLRGVLARLDELHRLIDERFPAVAASAKQEDEPVKEDWEEMLM